MQMMARGEVHVCVDDPWHDVLASCIDNPLGILSDRLTDPHDLPIGYSDICLKLSTWVHTVSIFY